MTRLTIAEDSGEEFAIRGHNTVADEDDDVIVFYADVIGVHVQPEPGSFTIQITTSGLTVEMDFADADSVRKALEFFEAKKVLEVNSLPPGSVRIIPSVEKEEEPKTYGEPVYKTRILRSGFGTDAVAAGRTSERELAGHSEALARN